MLSLLQSHIFGANLFRILSHWLCVCICVHVICIQIHDGLFFYFCRMRAHLYARRLKTQKFSVFFSFSFVHLWTYISLMCSASLTANALHFRMLAIVVVVLWLLFCSFMRLYLCATKCEFCDDFEMRFYFWLWHLNAAYFYVFRTILNLPSTSRGTALCRGPFLLFNRASFGSII